MRIDRSSVAESIFQAAADLRPDERERLLSERCGSDAELRAFVEELIAHHESGMGGFLCPPPSAARPEMEDGPAPGPFPPRRIGPYLLLEVCGEGGMGEVYIAEQTGPIRRRVAVKVIKWGMDTKEVIARFESERQALALMDHPHIAQVFDAGSTEEGRPYFVMEYVGGLPITEHCDRHRLNTRERLALFTMVCDGVQHAHQKAIIHRDLKPSNILVTMRDGRAIPKIIDFGVAKATSQRLTELTVYTELGQLIGTPEYMSPEQAEMSGQSVDTRTDIYSLGAVLYELLVGAKPFDSAELRGAGFDEIRRRIREVDPVRPSTRASSLGDALRESARNRRTDPDGLVGQLKGDLDWVTIKAMEKDRSRRYATAAELVADINRHLGDEPVAARPPSNWYRFEKFVRRHRAAVFAAGAVLLALTTGIAGTTMGLVRARQAHRVARAEAVRANQEAAAAQEVSDFLAGLFEISSPTEAEANSIRAREILDRGAHEIAWGLQGQPLVQARLMTTMGNVYANLGLLAEARPLAEQALEIRRRELGPQHTDLAETLNVLGRILMLEGEYEEARRRHEQAILIYETNLGPEDPGVANSLSNLGNVLRRNGDYDEAHRVLTRALEIMGNQQGSHRLERATILMNYAVVLEKLGQYDEARPCYEEVLEIREEELGPDHLDVSMALNNLADLMVHKGEYVAARPLLERSLRIRERTLGSEHLQVAIVLTNLAILMKTTGEYGDALVLYERALSIREGAFGPNHPEVAESLNNLGSLLFSTGEYARARDLFERSYTIKKETLRPNHPSIASALNNLAVVSLLAEDYARARAFAEDALRIREEAYGPSHPRVAETLTNLVSIALESEVVPMADARSYAERALGINEASLGSDHPAVAQSLKVLSEVLIRQEEFEPARPLLERALSIERSKFGDVHASVGMTLFRLAEFHDATGSTAVAESLHTRALAVREEALGADHPDVAESLEALGRVLREAGRLEESERFLARARGIRSESPHRPAGE